MGIRIFGLGVGAIILMFLWSLTLVVFTACLKVGRIMGAVATFALAALISTILLVWPNANVTRAESVEARKVDNVLLARLCLILILSIVCSYQWFDFAVTTSRSRLTRQFGI
uniref:Ubiquitin-associated and SH3 domain-containing protein B n=1 Tax=Parascaris univalens TaxID=6257 RepID=A0A915AXD5_PARUN